MSKRKPDLAVHCNCSSQVQQVWVAYDLQPLQTTWGNAAPQNLYRWCKRLAAQAELSAAATAACCCCCYRLLLPTLLVLPANQLWSGLADCSQESTLCKDQAACCHGGRIVRNSNEWPTPWCTKSRESKQNTLKFKRTNYTTGTFYASNPKWDANMFMVANQEGMQYCKPRVLLQCLQQAARFWWDMRAALLHHKESTRTASHTQPQVDNHLKPGPSVRCCP